MTIATAIRTTRIGICDRYTFLLLHDRCILFNHIYDTASPNTKWIRWWDRIHSSNYMTVHPPQFFCVSCILSGDQNKKAACVTASHQRRITALRANDTRCVTGITPITPKPRVEFLIVFMLGRHKRVARPTQVSMSSRSYQNVETFVNRFR